MAGRRNSKRRRPSGWRIGIDAGGTFTDFVALAPGELVAFKVPSTPDDPSRAIQHALQEFARQRPDAGDPPPPLVHGSTVATNALLEGNTARVVFVTNEGFEDLIEIGRQARDDLYALEPRRPPALLSRACRLGVPERTDAGGRRERRPTAADLEALRDAVRRQHPEAVAVGLLHSFQNPAAEREIARALRPLGVPVTCSSEVAPRFREYERYSTTVANAALLPVVHGYLQRLRRRLAGHDLLIQQSNGGLTSVRDASRTPVRLVLSGPAGGVHGAVRRLQDSGIDRAVSFDMGGTSTDVCMIDGEAGRVDRMELAGRPLLVETMDVQSIGAGGGSILWLDPAGALRVGPRSAGADPGPACYGRGTLPCLTDAHVVLGRLPAPDRLGGAIEVQPERSRRALQELAARLQVSVEEVAAAALEIADATMEKAIKSISLERGHDPRLAALFSFGGAGGLHACRLARRLGMPEAVVPPVPGASSAFGMAVSDARLDVTQGVVGVLDRSTFPRLRERLARLAERARRRLVAELGEGRVRVERRLSCRYQGQSFELSIPFGARYRRDFEDLHERRYGFRLPDTALESVALTATAVRPTPPLAAGPVATGPESALPSVRTFLPTARGGLQVRRVPVLRRSGLAVGREVRGPAIVVESTATTFVEPGFVLRVDPAGSLRLTQGST